MKKEMARTRSILFGRTRTRSPRGTLMRTNLGILPFIEKHYSRRAHTCGLCHARIFPPAIHSHKLKGFALQVLRHGSVL
jgi:hypothetical protein